MSLFQAEQPKYYLFSIMAGGLVLALPFFASAASMYISPATGIHTAGSTFTVEIMIDTAGRSSNAAEGIVLFPKENLEVIKIFNNESIFEFWTEGPAFSNKEGTINFAGGTLSGFNGSSGKIISIEFRAIREGTSRIRFDSGAVLAADGTATNILSSFQGGVYTVRPETPQTLPQAEYVPPAGSPPAPAIRSSTHPDPNKWYATRDVELFWDIAEDVTSVRILMDRKPDSIPTVNYRPPINRRKVENLGDGAWYFHLQAQNRHGWGGVARFRIQIDSQNPEFFKIRRLEPDDPSDPYAVFSFEAYDDVSGIEYYEVQIAGREPEIWIDEGDGIYRAPLLKPGFHTMIVKAYDRARNYLVDAAGFAIKPIEPPVFYDYPDVLQSGSFLALRGKSYPDTEIVIRVQKNGGDPAEYRVGSNYEGFFSFVAPEKPDDGVYKIWASAIDKRGAESGYSRIITVAVTPPPIIRIGSLALGILSVIVPLAALAGISVFGFAYLHHKFALFRKRLRKEAREAETVLHEAFFSLKKAVAEHLAELEEESKERTLTLREIELMKKMKTALNLVEKKIEKEIKDIEAI